MRRSGHHIVWLDLAAIADYGKAGVECVAGTTGRWTGMPPSGPLGILVVPDDAISIEGSHGVDGDGFERPTRARECGFEEKLTAESCRDTAGGN